MVPSPPIGLFDLTGRLAVVTGARRGIGLAFAEALAAAGADIVGVSASADHEQARTRVEAHGRAYTAIAADLSRRDAVLQVARRLAALEVDILVNNAGTIRREPAAAHSDAAWDDVLAVDLDAPFILARELGARMVERGRGKIVFTASVLSFQGGVTVPGYAAAKHAVVGITRALANEWASSGVNVNAIAPGYVETDNTEALRADPARYAAVLDRIPAGRWGRPEDFAGAVVFLCSDAADWVHGAVLAVDGGWLAR
jgi:2-deoxy-D-gluconate 3-dehydrogenase